jgi:hypothetical protein
MTAHTAVHNSIPDAYSGRVKEASTNTVHRAAELLGRVLLSALFLGERARLFSARLPSSWGGKRGSPPFFWPASRF